MELICLQLVFGYFNPRSREGSDKVEIAKADGTKISIHAPARGATAIHTGLGFDLWVFQSTLPRGERLLLVSCVLVVCVFQSTLPRGERLLKVWIKTSKSNFNPRSREGSDIISELF